MGENITFSGIHNKSPAEWSIFFYPAECIMALGGTVLSRLCRGMADVDPTGLEVVNPTGGTADVQLRLAVLCVVALCSSVKLRVRF